MIDFIWKLFNNHILKGGRRCRDRVASLLITLLQGVREKTGWLGIRIMSPSGATCLPANKHYKNPSQRVGQGNKY
jgi:hypothetical protein